jgi:hypothetical protein
MFNLFWHLCYGLLAVERKTPLDGDTFLVIGDLLCISILAGLLYEPWVDDIRHRL